MKNRFLLFLVCLLFGGSHLALSQSSKKKADKDTFEWRYEIEASEGTGVEGTYQVKVWSYSKKPQTAIEQAKKNAVHGIIFRGFPDKNRVKGQMAIATNPNLEIEKEDFFKEFFADGGKFQKFVTVVNNGAVGAGDVIKIGKEYKVGVLVSVNVKMLRKDLENSGIIKGLSDGF